MKVGNIYYVRADHCYGRFACAASQELAVAAYCRCILRCTGFYRPEAATITCSPAPLPAGIIPLCDARAAFRQPNNGHMARAFGALRSLPDGDFEPAGDAS